MIHTLTLNPAIDKLLFLPEFKRTSPIVCKVMMLLWVEREPMSQ